MQPPATTTLKQHNTANSEPRKAAPRCESSTSRAQRQTSAGRVSGKRQRAATGHNASPDQRSLNPCPNPVKRNRLRTDANRILFVVQRTLQLVLGTSASILIPVRAATQHTAQATQTQPKELSQRGPAWGAVAGNLANPEAPASAPNLAHCSPVGGAMSSAHGNPPPGVQSPASTDHPNRPS